MALVIFRTRKDQNKSKFKKEIQQFDLTLYGICTSCFIFQLSIYLYELMTVKYLAFHMEVQKRGMATIPSGQTQILLFLPIIRSVPS